MNYCKNFFVYSNSVTTNKKKSWMEEVFPYNIFHFNGPTSKQSPFKTLAEDSEEGNGNFSWTNSLKLPFNTSKTSDYNAVWEKETKNS